MNVLILYSYLHTMPSGRIVNVRSFLEPFTCIRHGVKSLVRYDMIIRKRGSDNLPRVNSAYSSLDIRMRRYRGRAGDGSAMEVLW